MVESNQLMPVSSIENKAAFYARIESLDLISSEKIKKAYNDAKECHRFQDLRDDGQRYFEHLRGAALVLMDECGIYDPDIISAALLHDSVEDQTMFGSPKGIKYSEWMSNAFASISVEHGYGARVAEMVIAVTKPVIDGEEIKTKEDADSMYYRKIGEASVEALLVKMADRLNNMRSLGARPIEKQRKVAHETLEHYIPLFERAREKYPEAAEVMIVQIRELALKYLN